MPFEIITKAVDLPSANQGKIQNFLGITKGQNTSLHDHMFFQSQRGGSGRPSCRTRTFAGSEFQLIFRPQSPFKNDSNRTSSSEGCTGRHGIKHFFLKEPINHGPAEMSRESWTRLDPSMITPGQAGISLQSWRLDPHFLPVIFPKSCQPLINSG